MKKCLSAVFLAGLLVSWWCRVHASEPELRPSDKDQAYEALVFAHSFADALSLDHSARLAFFKRAQLYATRNSHRPRLTEAQIFKTTEKVWIQLKTAPDATEYTVLGPVFGPLAESNLFGQYVSKAANYFYGDSEAEREWDSRIKRLLDDRRTEKDHYNDVMGIAVPYFYNCTDAECKRGTTAQFGAVVRDTMTATAAERLQRKPHLQARASRVLYDTRQERLFADERIAEAGASGGAPSSPMNTQSLPGLPPLDRIALNYAQLLSESVRTVTTDAQTSTFTGEDVYATGQIANALFLAKGRGREAQAVSILATSFGHMVTTLEKGSQASDLVKAGAVMGSVGAIFTVASMFSSSRGGETAAILEALQRISQQIADLQQMTAQGFYRTEVRLDGIQNEMSFGFDRMFKSSRFVDENIGSLLDYRLLDQETLALQAMLGRNVIAQKHIHECSPGRVTDSVMAQSCEVRLLHGALFDSQYTMKGPGVAWASFWLKGHPVPYAFHDAYGDLFQTVAKSDDDGSKIDPYYWRLFTMALLEFQDTIAVNSPEEIGRRRAQMLELEQSGMRLESQLSALSSTRSRQSSKVCVNEAGAPCEALSCSTGDAEPCDPVQRAAIDYFSQLTRLPLLASRFLAVSAAGQVVRMDPKTLPAPGPARAQLENLVNGAYAGISTITACAGINEQNFQPAKDPAVDPAVLSGTQLKAWRKGWDSKALNKANLDRLPYLDIAPAPAIWAQQQGLGRLHVCFSKLRPTDVHFTNRRHGNHHFADADIEAEVSVFFEPDSSADAQNILGNKGTKPRLIATRGISFSCQGFMYRHEVNSGEYRGKRISGMYQVERTFSDSWNGGKACGALTPSDRMIATPSKIADQALLDRFVEALKEREKPLVMDVMARLISSAAYQDALLAYIRLYTVQQLNARLELKREVGENDQEPPAITRSSQPQQFVLPRPDEILSRMMERQVSSSNIDQWRRENLAMIENQRTQHHEHWDREFDRRADDTANWINLQLDEVRKMRGALRGLANDLEVLSNLAPPPAQRSRP